MDTIFFIGKLNFVPFFILNNIIFIIYFQMI